MNFEIITENGIGKMTWNQATDIRTNIWLSLNINYGSFFADPTFGCKLFQIKKITPGNIKLAQQYIQEALAWMIPAGRATSIEVLVEQDTFDTNRLNIQVNAIQPDGLLIIYKEFRPVGLGTKFDYTYNNGVLKNLGAN